MATYLKYIDKTDIFASGLTNTDYGVLIIASGDYVESLTINNTDHPSGTIVFSCENNTQVSGIIATGSGAVMITNADLHTVDFMSGTISIENVTLGENDSLSSTFDTGTDVQLRNVDIRQNVYLQSLNYLNVEEFSISGNYARLFASGITETMAVSSGCIVYGSGILLNNCSGITVDRCYSHNVSGVPLEFISCSGFTINYNTVTNIGSGAIKCTDSSGNIFYSIVTSSGAEPVTSHSSIVIASGCGITNYANIGVSYDSVSGTYTALDPLLTDIDGGGLRLNVNSPYACAGGRLDTSPFDTSKISTSLNYHAIKFYNHEGGGKTTRPSGVYIVQDGKAVYLKAASGNIGDMDIIINVKYESEGTVLTEQSMIDTENNNVQYDKDYRILYEYNEDTRKMEYVVEPFTMIPLSGLITNAVDSITNVIVSGFYDYRGLSYDPNIYNDSEMVYWVLERTNNYLMKYSIHDNELQEVLPLFIQTNASGVYRTIKLDDIEILSRGLRDTTYLTTKFYESPEDVAPQRKSIISQNKEPYFRFKAMRTEPNKFPGALVDFSDRILMACKEKISPSGSDSMILNVYMYDKFKKDFHLTPTIISGVLGIEDYTPVDMTVDDEQNLYIASSGALCKYIPRYDYAHASRLTGDKHTTITFRERYEGVNL
jgi:hypothetical protein